MANEQWDKVVDKDKIEANEVTTATIHATSLETSEFQF